MSLVNGVAHTIFSLTAAAEYWELLEPQRFWAFVYFVLPGVVGVQAWDMLVPSARRSAPELLLKAVVFSVVNVAFVLPVLDLLFSGGRPGSAYRVSAAGALLALPVVEAFAARKAVGCSWLRGRGVVHPTPTAWDYFFRLERPCWLLLHLKSGQTIGGYYGECSFSSSFPNPEQIYLEQVWVAGPTGPFDHAAVRSAGALVSMSECVFVEAFEDEPETTNG